MGRRVDLVLIERGKYPMRRGKSVRKLESDPPAERVVVLILGGKDSGKRSLAQRWLKGDFKTSEVRGKHAGMALLTDKADSQEPFSVRG